MKFRQRVDGQYIVDPGKDYNYLLMFPSGKPDGWKFPPTWVPAEKAFRLSDAEKAVIEGVRQREIASLENVQQRKRGKKPLVAKGNDDE